MKAFSIQLLSRFHCDAVAIELNSDKEMLDSLIFRHCVCFSDILKHKRIQVVVDTCRQAQFEYSRKVSKFVKIGGDRKGRQ